MQLSQSFQHPVHSRGSSGSGSLVFLFSLYLVKTNSVTVACFCRSGPGTSEDVPADTHLKTTPPSHPPVPVVAAAAAAAVVQRPDRRPCTVQMYIGWAMGLSARRHPGHQSEHVTCISRASLFERVQISVSMLFSFCLCKHVKCDCGKSAPFWM